MFENSLHELQMLWFVTELPQWGPPFYAVARNTKVNAKKRTLNKAYNNVD